MTAGQRLHDLHHPNGDPAACAARCEHDGALPRLELLLSAHDQPTGGCRLKNKVPQRVKDACCVSGVRGAGVIEPREDGIEYSIDRLGGDYRNFDTPMEAAGAPCKAACEADNHCRAWTYVRPGYIERFRALLSQEQIHAPAPQAVLHFGRRALRRAQKQRLVTWLPRLSLIT